MANAAAVARTERRIERQITSQPQKSEFVMRNCVIYVQILRHH